MPEDRTRLETLREHSDFKLQGEIIGRNERSDQCINEFVSSPFLIHFSLHLTCIAGQGEVIVCVCVVCPSLSDKPERAGHFCFLDSFLENRWVNVILIKGVSGEAFA